MQTPLKQPALLTQSLSLTHFSPTASCATQLGAVAVELQNWPIAQSVFEEHLEVEFLKHTFPSQNSAEATQSDFLLHGPPRNWRVE